MAGVRYGADDPEVNLRPRHSASPRGSHTTVGTFIDQVSAFADAHDLRLETAREAGRRGSHVSYAHAHGYELMQALIARGVVGDFRTPDVARFGFTPLYVGYADVWRAAEVFKSLLESGEWRDPVYAVRARVT